MRMTRGPQSRNSRSPGSPAIPRLCGPRDSKNWNARNKPSTFVEARVAPDAAVQQCYRVSPGPDFVLVVHTQDMPGYHALAQRLFTVDANVRNVKAFFSVKRSKFGVELPLGKKECHLCR